MTKFLKVLIVLISTFVSGAIHAQDRENVIMVLDASGSMWAQIDGVTKIEIAREAIGEMVADWDENSNLGLIAYGHREKGNCSDIETLLSPAPLNAAQFTDLVNGLSPKGKTPISASVRQAAEAMAYTENKATVILISDGLETCEADPCALATELESTGVDFTAHVIGFDLSANDAPQLACLAENSGGAFISAGNAAELNDAIQTTVQVVKAEVVVEVVEPEPEPEPQGPQGLKLIGVPCAACEPLKDDLFWWGYDPTQDASGNRTELFINGSASPLVETEARDFYIVGRYGDAYASATATVEPGKLTELVVNFNAGNLRLDAAPTEGAEILKDNMFYWVYENKADLEGNRKEIVISGSATELFRLSAGEYYVVARHGSAYANEVVTILPGELTELTFDMNVGYLRTSAIPTIGAEVLKDAMFYWVYEDKKDLEGNRKEIEISGSASELFRLPAGTYYVVARHGNAFANATIEIDANTLTEHQFDMNVGYLRTQAVPVAGAEPLKEKIFYWVYDAKKDLEGNRKEIEISSSASELFRLPVGEYVLVTRHGTAFSETPVTITAGELLEVTAIQNSATIRVSAVMADGSALAGNTFWRVLSGQADLEGKRDEVSISGSKEETFILPEGDYILSVRNGDIWYDTPISLTAGEAKQIEVSIK